MSSPKFVLCRSLDLSPSGYPKPALSKAIGTRGDALAFDTVQHIRVSRIQREDDAYLVLTPALISLSGGTLAQTTPAMPMDTMTPVKMGSVLINGKIPASGTVSVNGAQVAFKSVGSGKLMLLIHGYPLSGELFKDNRTALATAGFQGVASRLRPGPEPDR